jgi:hypothetical protein
MTKTLRLLFLLFALSLPVIAQTGPGSIQPNVSGTGNAQSAATANGNGGTIPVKLYGAAAVTLTISGTATVNFEGQITSAASWTARYGYAKTDSTKALVSSTTSSGDYFLDLAGDENFRARISGCAACTVTVTVKQVPATARVGAPSGGGSTSLAIGATAITGGTTGRVLFDNAGVVGEDADFTFATDTVTITKAVIGGGSAITSSGPGGALGSNAFTSTAYAPVASPTFTGTVTIPTPFTLGAVSVASTGTQLNYLNASSGTTGTTSTNVVFSTSPTLVTPTLGVASATSETLTGTGGAGFIDLAVQSSAPSTPASNHIRIFNTSVNKFGWIGASGNVRTFDGTLTASRVYTLPDADTSFPVFGQTITFAGPTAARTVTLPDANFTAARTDAGQTFIGPQVITEVVGSSALTITGATQTSSNPVINISQTWSNSGVAFTGIKANFTNTASLTSLLMDLQLGGTSLYSWNSGGKFTETFSSGATVLVASLTNQNAGLYASMQRSGGATLLYGVEPAAGGGIITGSLANAGVIGTSASHPFQIGTNDTPRLTITSTGNIGFGATAAGTSAVNAQVYGLATAPTTSPANTLQTYVVAAATNDAQFYARTEAGQVNRLTGLAAVVGTQFDKTSDTTLANVTGLTRNVEAGRTYGFEAVLYTTSNVAGGVKAAIAGTATATSVIYEAVTEDGGTIGAQSRTTTLGSAVGAVTTVTAAKITITGTIVVNAAGTLTVQFAQNAINIAASSVLINSTFRLIPIT